MSGFVVQHDYQQFSFSSSGMNSERKTKIVLSTQVLAPYSFNQRSVLVSNGAFLV